MTKIIPRNTTIPTKKSEVFSTAVDNQTNVEIHILQGEREMYKDNKSLGNFRLNGIPLAPRGVPQIEVTFDIDVNGILSVTAKDKSSGKEQSITIQNASTLDKTEVERMVEEAQKYADIDKLKREQIDLKNQAELLCYQSEKQIKEFEGKISEQKTKEVNELIVKIKETISLENFDTLKLEVENLNKIMMEVNSEMSKNTNEPVSNAPKKDNVDDFIDVN